MSKVGEWVTMLTGRKGRKTAAAIAGVRQALIQGAHVHVSTRDGQFCAGGDPECPWPRTTRPDYGLGRQK
jgi:hypothetical protein